MPLIELEDVAVAFGPPGREVTVVDGASFSIDAGETVALVGESGSGKSVTALAIMGLLQDPGRVTRGTIRYDGRDLTKLDDRALSAIRGDRIAMIFQEPMSSLNPMLSVGGHVAEPLRLHRGLSRGETRRQAIALLDRVGIPSAARRFDDYPHRMSGGMRQRVMIAAALACRPALLIADEPTTALDVTIQAQIMDLLADLQAEFGMGILFITHDLGVVAETARRVIVMYAGRKVEEAEVGELFARPMHPYTMGLLASIPRLDLMRGEVERVGQRLQEIPGIVPPLFDLPEGCAFAPRCERADDLCRRERPAYQEKRPGHWAACWHSDG